MNVASIDKNMCTGCGLCVAVCPRQCLSMQENEEGFSIPVIDDTCCVDCGLCYQKCITISSKDGHSPSEVFAMQRYDKHKILSSASGGASALFVEHVIQQKGVAYGCVMDDSFAPKHIRTDSMLQAEAFKGSKYVQSDFSNVYVTIKQDCESGLPVIVVGTPCQIAAIRLYLKKEYDNLILVDLICHGVPSPKLFQAYLDWLGKRMGGDVKHYYFRDKTLHGWDTTYKAQTSTASSTGMATLDPFYSAYIYGEIYRESCYHCKYAQRERQGDITIGDFWGVKKLHPEAKIDVADGVSIVLINTPKGKQLFEEVEKNMVFFSSTMENAMKENSNLYQPAVRPEIRDEFYKCVDEYGFAWAERRMRSQKRYYVSWAKQKIPPRMKKALKKLLKRG